SATQGPHHVAQRLMSVGLPLSEGRASCLPFASRTVKSGSGLPLCERSSWPVIASPLVVAVPAAGDCCAAGSLCLSQPPASRAQPRTASLNDRENSKTGSNTMWGGRFAEGPSAIMREINASIPFDKALWRQDIAASRAHVAMLGAQRIVAAEDVKAILDGLD